MQSHNELATLADRYAAQIDLAHGRSSADTGAGAGFAAVGFNWRMQRGIVRALQQASAVGAQVAQGNVFAHCRRSDQ